MTDLKPCLRCERPIDRFAKLCVYCNWDQNNTEVPPHQQTSAPPAYVPPPDNRARNRLIGAAGLTFLIVGAFLVGIFIHGADAKEVKTPLQAELPAPENSSRKRSNVTLVPIDASDPSLTIPIDQPITTAPSLQPGQDPNDATALPLAQYAAAEAKVKAQKKAQEEAVDPRTLRGRAYEIPVAAPPPPPQPADETAPEATAPAPAPAPERETETPSTNVERSLGRTEAYPEYKPLPHISVEQDTTARLILTVGADGRVKAVDITDPIPGETSKLIGAVQKWRFRPATENGTPVSARVSVTITLHGNE